MARTSLLFGWLLAAALWALASVLLVSATDSSAPNLLSNGGFENGTSVWLWLGGNLATVDSPTYEGGHAGSIELTTSLAVVRQQVSLAPGGSYQLSGRFRYTNPPVSSIRLELEWQDTNSAMDSKGFILTDSDGSSWLAALVPVTNLPCEAVKAAVRVLVTCETGSTVLLDDLRLKGSPPATPCPTPTATAMPSPTSTPTVPPSATSTPPGTPTA